MQGEPEQCRGRLRAVDESKAFFRRQREWRESGACECCRTGLAPIVMPGLAFADEHEREVREWCEIAARANRSARWHNGMHAAIQQVDEALQRPQGDAGEALRQHIRPQGHRRAHDWNRKRVADAGGVTAKQVDLQLGERVARNANLGEVAEPRIDAVDGLVAARERVDDGARRGHARARLVC